MATYIELYDLRANDALRVRVASALAVKAAAILALEAPTAKQLAWALDAIIPSNTDSLSRAYLNYLLAANAALTVAQIQAASDSAIQTQINAAVDKLTV